jgi:hypothetical protein
MVGTKRTALGTAAAFALLFRANMLASMPIAGGELRVSRTDAVADCPDEHTLGSLTLALGVPPADVSTELVVEVELDRDEAGYVARIRASGRKSGTREIRSDGESCEQLAQATSVALAILFDLLPQGPALPDPPRLSLTAPRPMPKPTSDAAHAALGPPARPPEPPAVAWLGAYGGIASGLLGHALTGHVGATLRFPQGRVVELGFGGFWAPGRELSHVPGSVSVFLLAGKSDLTFAIVQSERVALRAGAGISIGNIVGSGDGYDRDHTAWEFWLAPGLTAFGRLRLSQRWALALATTPHVPSRTQTFSVHGVPGTAFEGAPAAVLIELGPELAFF